MAKHGSGSAGLLVDGYDLRSAKVKSLRHKVEAPQEDSTGIGDSWQEFTPAGVSKVEVAQEGAFFDTTATTGIHAGMSGSVPTTPQATRRVLCFWYAGNAQGSPFMGCEGDYTASYEVLAQVGALTKANVVHLISGKAEPGVILQHLTAKTSDWNTKTDGNQVDFTADPSQQVVPINNISVANPTVVTTTHEHGLTNGQKVLLAGSNSTPTINGDRVATVTSTTTFTVPVNVTVLGNAGTMVKSDTPGGGAGYQHVTAFSGFTGFVGTIKDSPDDITYTELIAFTNVTSAPTAERKTVSGTVDRYLSFDGNVTGSGSITVFCGFARY